MSKISKPGVYKGYSEVKYDGWKRYSEYVQMRDGVKIAVDYYRPTRSGVVEEKPLPVVWILTPYDYRTVFATGKFTDGTPYTPEIEEDTLGQAKLLSAHGYVFALAEVRGTGASFGFRRFVNSDLEAWDGYEICQWLASQKWCDGNTGTFGYSYYGATQLQMLRKNPPALKACFIGMTDIDKYDGWVRGGILRTFGTQPDAGYLEDMKNVAVGTEGTEEEQEVLKEACVQHRFSSGQAKSMKQSPYRDSYSEEIDENTWEYMSNTTYLEKINQADATIYLYGGWRDVFRRDTMIMWRNMKHAKKMLFGSWHHMDYRPGFDIATEKLRFFDYTLKGIENGIMDESPIYYSYGTGTDENDNEWTAATDWPLPDIKRTSFFFNGGKSGTAPSFNDGVLSQKAPEGDEEKDDYKVNYDIAEDVDRDLKTVSRDTNGVTYTSKPLEEDMYVAGHPIMDMWISSTAEDGDIFVHLIDVDEKGDTRWLCDGKLRASLRRVAKPPYDFMGLPWHPANKADEHKMVPGNPYRLQIDMMPCAHLFKKGHRIRVTVCCACKRMYFLQEEEPPILSIYRNGVFTSYISLPIASKLEK